MSDKGTEPAPEKTLRDEFAMIAANALITESPVVKEWPINVAKACYTFAEAMLIARKLTLKELGQ